MNASFFRYVAVGVAHNAVFYALTLVLIGIDIPAWQALIVLYPVAVVVSFTINRNWSFRAVKIHKSQLPKYVCVYAIAYPTTVVLTWAQETMGVPSWLATLFTMAGAVVAIYLALEKWVFALSRRQQQA